jgi:predicted O-methyltransferase YrrM
MQKQMPIRNALRRILPPRAYATLRNIKSSPARLFQWTFERCGFVVARSGDFYSPLPSRRKLRSTMPRWSQPSALRGVSYDLDAMKSTLTTLIGTYAEEFASLIPYEQALQLGFGPGYTLLDAQVLYATLRTHKPARYLEVGSGLSTFYAAQAALQNEREGRSMQIACIEPFPFAALHTIPGITLIEKEVQDVALDRFTALGPGDVLFIDSSHIVRLDGDVPFLFLEVLPALAPGPLIHIHDIPFPFHCPYPPDYWIYKSVWPMWWNESMLLHALLCGNPSFAITLSTPLLRFHDETFLQSLIPGYQTIAGEPNTFSSIWLQRL